jgi:hypothetical protein
MRGDGAKFGGECGFGGVKRAFMLVWRGLVAYRLGA